jgi:predicted nucleic acid-binding protein
LQAISDLAQVGVIEDANLSAVVWRAAGELKATHRRVSLADCFAIELAVRLQAMILTADHHEFDALADRASFAIKFIPVTG